MVVSGCTVYFMLRLMMAPDDDNHEKYETHRRLARKQPKHIPDHMQQGMILVLRPISMRWHTTHTPRTATICTMIPHSFCVGEDLIQSKTNTSPSKNFKRNLRTSMVPLKSQAFHYQSFFPVFSMENKNLELHFVVSSWMLYYEFIVSLCCRPLLRCYFFGSHFKKQVAFEDIKTARKLLKICLKLEEKRLKTEENCIILYKIYHNVVKLYNIIHLFTVGRQKDV